MYKLTVRFAAVVGALLLVSVALPFAAEAEPVENAGPFTCIQTEFDESVDVALDPALAKPGLPGGCLPSTALTCASMPIPVGGTCSCSSTLLEQKCKSCDGRFKGRTLRTTCTVHVPCTNPPCDLQANFSRTAFSCVP